mmetsp:Transcript_49878/g.113279  ORF Transcript_49878/g.113279 Transcript_49878/m.113279 type:complete len:453 (+) Transcript_49878:187-1545(+)
MNGFGYKTAELSAKREERQVRRQFTRQLLDLERLERPRPDARPGDEGVRVEACGLFILFFEVRNEPGCARGLNERDDAAPEAAPGHARAINALEARREIHQGVQLQAAHLEVVPQRRVRGEHGPPHRLELAALERLDGRNHAEVLVNHVPRAPVSLVIHRAFGAALEHDGRGVPQLRHLGVELGDGLGGGLALGYARRVLRAREGVLHVAVGHQDDRVSSTHGHRRPLVGPAVDLEQFALLPESADKLVHNSAGHTAELVLGGLAAQRLGLLGDAAAPWWMELLEHGGRRHLESGRTREARAEGHVRRERRLECELLARGKVRRILLHDSLDVIGPERVAGSERLGLGIEGHRAALHPDAHHCALPSVRVDNPAGEDHHGALLEGQRKHEAARVIRVLSNQIHTTWGLRGQRWRGAESLGEGFCGSFEQWQRSRRVVPVWLLRILARVARFS